MASAVMGSIGSAVGSTAAGTFGWTAATWSQIGWTAGVLAANYLFTPDGEEIVSEGPRLNELKVTSSAYGLHIPKVYGKYRISGNIIWATDFAETRHVEETESGGKGGGGGSSSTNIWYTYSVSLAIALCEGPIFGVRKVWFDSQLVYDHTDNYGQTSSLFSAIRIYMGGKEQSIDPAIQAQFADTPAYRNTAYLVFEDLQLESVGNRIPNITAEVHRSDIRSTLIDIWGGGNILNMDTATMTAYLNIRSTDSITGGISGGTIDQYNIYNYAYQGDYVKILEKTYAPDITKTDETQPQYWLILLHKGRSYDNTTYMVKNRDTNLNYLIKQGLKDTIRLGVIEDYNVWGFVHGHYQFAENNKLYVWSDTNGTIGNFFIISFTSNSYYWNVSSQIKVETGIIAEDGYSSRVYCGFYNEKIYVIKGSTVVPDVSYMMSFYEYDGITGDFIGQTDTLIGPEGKGYGGIDSAVPGEFAVDSEGFHLFIGELYWKFLPDKSYDRKIPLYFDNNIDTVWPEVDYGHTWTGTWMYKDGWLFNLKQLGFGGAATSVIYQYRTIPDGTNSQTLEGYSYLSNIIEDICIEAGLEQSDLNLNIASQKYVTGYVISKSMTARSAIQALLNIYEYALYENNHTLELKDLEETPVVTIDESEIIDNSLEINKRQEINGVRRASVVYSNVDSDYQNGVQSASRSDVHAKNEIIKELPMSLTDTEAKQLVELILYREWSQYTSFSFSLPSVYMNLKPTQVITLTQNNFSHQVRLVSVDFADNGTIKCSAVGQNNANYTSEAIGTDTGANGGTVRVPVGESVIEILDIPTLHNSVVSVEGLYAASYGISETWRGCTIFSKTSTADNFYANVVLLGKAKIGETTTVLPSGRLDIIDTSNTVTVSCYDLLEASTDIDLVENSTNYALVGNEILQFANVIDNDDDTYTLSNFIRGRRGTEHEIGKHVSGELFVLLEQSVMDFIPKSINNADLYGSLSIGQDIDDISVFNSVVNTGINLRPFSIEYLRSNGTAGSDISLKWMRRSRYISSRFNRLPIVDTPELYSIEVYNKEVLVNTYSSSTESFSYTVAMQNTDGVLADANVSFIVYHVSGVYGRGIESDTLEVFGDLNPVVYWDLNETTGSTVIVDSVGGNNGSLVSSPLFEQPSLIRNNVGTSMYFDGTDDRIQFTDADVFSIGTSGELSFSFFIKPSDLLRTGILNKIQGYYEGSLGYEWQISHNGARISATIYDENGQGIKLFTSSTTLQVGTTYHIVVNFFGVSSSNRDIQVFIDGEEQGNVVSPTSRDSGYDNVASAANPRIGYLYDQDSHMNGFLDEVKIFNKTLSQAQVLQLGRT